MKKHDKKRATRKRAPVKATGGAGFTFADKVGGHFLLELLRGGIPLGVEAGPIMALHFEVRESGWQMDDQLLVMKNVQGETRCAVSVKSDSRLTAGGLDREFVSDAWQQWDGVEGASFDREKDVLALATRPVAPPVAKDWNEIVLQARAADPDRVADRFAAGGPMSAAKRRLFESVQISDGGGAREPVESVKLLSRLRTFFFDFDAVPSSDEGRAIEVCRNLTRTGTLDEGRKLWDRLEELAKQGRSAGGSFDLTKLVRSLRGLVELRNYPEFASDWEAVEDRSEANMNAVRLDVGDGIHLDRTEECAVVLDAVAKNVCTALVGESGTGKSAAVVEAIRESGRFQRVLWLNAQQLSQASQPDLTRSLGLRNSIEIMLGSSCVGEALLVLDGFEQLRDPARSRALELAKTAAAAGAGKWKILLTVQLYDWAETRQALLDVGIRDVQRVDFGNPDPQEVLAKLRGVSGVEALFRRRELQPILCNLTTLHWVIRTEQKRRFETDKLWVGEAELIEWIWKHWVGEASDRHVRDVVLCQLGEIEGERVSGAVPRNGLDFNQLRLIGEFEREGVLRVTDSAVLFSHDLVGDWARLRSVIVAGDQAVARIREKAGTPRWGRAIRLYAQSLVERDDNLASWKAVVATLSRENPQEKLASDLFLDGMIFAANAEILLDRVWLELIANKAEILRRLLERVRLVATFPDWRYQLEMPAEDADLAAAWFRIPNPLYWMPLLRVLARRADELAREGVFDVANVCMLWLRTMPVGFPGRREAGIVALGLARELQGRRAEGVEFIGDAGKTLFESLLCAAPEFPEAVSEIALELCGRRAEGEALRDRRVRATEETQKEKAKATPEVHRRRVALAPSFFPTSWGPLIASGPDGPKRRVPDGFRVAVLESIAIQSLASVRPAVAREVLLAVSLDEPRRQSEFERERFSLPGFAYWPNGAPPMYWKGGFLRLLQTAPEEGTEAILRLVNFATEQWLKRAFRHAPNEEERRRTSLEFVVGGKSVWWAGNGNVFAWHRDDPNIPDVVVSSLMALEKWLYELLEKGEAIDRWAETIFEKGQSLAFAGVLVAVGLRYPDLFRGVLQPLLGSPEVYETQRQLAIYEREGLWKPSLLLWAKQEKAWRLAAEWHELPHRHFILQTLAVHRMLTEEATREFLVEQRKKWAERLAEMEGGGRERFEYFLAQFDPQNYTVTTLPDASTQFEYKLPADLEIRSQQARQQGSIKMAILQLPTNARKAIAQGVGLKEESLEATLAQLKQIAVFEVPLDDTFLAERKVESLAGGIAVLVLGNRGWLASNAEAERWCFATLAELSGRRPAETYSPLDMMDTATEGFVGQAAVGLLTETSDEWVKRAVVGGLTGHHYRATFHVLNTAYRRRDSLGDEFARLENAMLLWAILRRAAERAFVITGDRGIVERYREIVRQRYLRGRIPATPTGLRKANELGRRVLRRLEAKRPERWGFGSERGHREKLDRVESGLDLEVVRHGMGFLTEKTADASQRAEVLDRVGELLQFELGLLPEMPPGDVDAEVEGPLYEFDTWVFGRVVHLLLSGITPEEARGLWKPILDLPAAAHESVREFFAQWFHMGLALNSPDFGQIWEEMVAYVLDSPAWGPDSRFRHSHVHEVVGEMMGIRSALETLGDKSHANLIERMAPSFESWAAQWVGQASLARSFAYFLATDAASLLLPMGIRQLAKALDSLSDYDWRRDRLKDAFSTAVRMGWKKYRQQLRSDPVFWAAFLAVLNALCARGDELSLAIRAESAL
jgi:hypothetical protein